MPFGAPRPAAPPASARVGATGQRLAEPSGSLCAPLFAPKVLELPAETEDLICPS